MKKKIKLLAILLMVLTQSALSQHSAMDVLSINCKPKHDHKFTSNLSVLLETKADPLVLSVNITIDSTSIQIRDAADFDLNLSVDGVALIKILDVPGLVFQLKSGDHFYLFWDEKKQDYNFSQMKFYKRFSKKTKYYPLIKQL